MTVVPDLKPRAALYVRVSTRDKGQTVENQLPVLRAFAIEEGWDIVATFEDHDHGDKPTREGFTRMMASAQLRQFDVLVFWSLDRFTREGVYPTLEHLQRLSTWGVRFRSYTEQYLDTCGVFRDAIIAILAALAKQEQLRLRERVRAGLARAKAQGHKAGRKPVDVDLGRFRRLINLYTVPEVKSLLQISETTYYKLRKLAELDRIAKLEQLDSEASPPPASPPPASPPPASPPPEASS